MIQLQLGQRVQVAPALKQSCGIRGRIVAMNVPDELHARPTCTMIQYDNDHDGYEYGIYATRHLLPVERKNPGEG